MTAPAIETAPVHETAWAPEAWDEPSPPCEIFFPITQTKCDNPAEVAFVNACCGYVKLLCSPHFEYLLHPESVDKDSYYECRNCRRRWSTNDFIGRSWRI